MIQNFLGILLILFTTCQAVTLNSQVTPVFEKYKELNMQFFEIADSKGDLQRESVEDYMYNEYREALKLFDVQYCSEPDKNVLDSFISVLIATSNSAYETPSFILGKIYICQPELLVNKINSLNPEDKKQIVNNKKKTKRREPKTKTKNRRK